MKILVTGSIGLIGSEVVSHFHNLGWEVHGIDNNMRANFFGADGSNQWNQSRLQVSLKGFWHHELDIRNRQAILECVSELRPDAVVHAAAQPSHSLSAQRPFDNFDINTVGTFNLLEAVRQFAPEAIFVFMSSNKVYGDAPNELPLKELETRWEYSRQEDYAGISEEMRLDRSTHSLFGATKVASDTLVQEYGRYFGMKTCCLRGGCLTGPNHSGVEIHGFLSYLVKVNISDELYRIYGYKGKQVRDNIHAYDVARFIEMFINKPRSGEVYNLGGGRTNSCSILEAFQMVENITGKAMRFEYEEKNRIGDHICYISNLSKARSHYPEWSITRDLPSIIEDIYKSWEMRLSKACA